MMLSKFSRAVLNSSYRLNPVFACKNTNSIIRCRNVRVPERSFYLNTHDLQKILPKSNVKSKSSKDVSAQSIGYYSMAVVVLCAGLTFAAVPLYRLFCQATGYGGTVVEGHDTTKVENMKRVGNRVLTIQFNADTAASMRWNFKPQQYEIKVVPGETALAFYTAKNPMDVPVIGVSTYNVIPFEAGQYFNKIQCFCFEAQQLNPHEEVDMPVFFYIDPEFDEDPKMEFVDTIVLSYTFFESKDGLNIPVPSYARTH
ncbi:cytochrome c oxidase assembly protein COX11, mitochondrial [Contarinia nasturtii]|uniref:cytochrome c oxidase assembly protein COX11, mitochondrial n=1 Tax=Contarinia nasturtii TaxID=265458 RepID=UPI0012D42840|nr:cytochrome c oxidase assembly protein COX11, mitochondrial [Contarinia nasturtii]